VFSVAAAFRGGLSRLVLQEVTMRGTAFVFVSVVAALAALATSSITYRSADADCANPNDPDWVQWANNQDFPSSTNAFCVGTVARFSTI
jgi:hypothetical protein